VSVKSKLFLKRAEYELLCLAIRPLTGGGGWKRPVRTSAKWRIGSGFAVGGHREGMGGGVPSLVTHSGSCTKRTEGRKKKNIWGAAGVVCLPTLTAPIKDNLSFERFRHNGTVRRRFVGYRKLSPKYSSEGEGRCPLQISGMR